MKDPEKVPSSSPQQPTMWSKLLTVANFSTFLVALIVAVTAAVALAITITSGEQAVGGVVDEYISNIQQNVIVSFRNMFQSNVDQMASLATLMKWRWPVCPHGRNSTPYPMSRDSLEIDFWRTEFVGWLVESNYTLFGFGVGFEDGSYYDVTIDGSDLVETIIPDPEERATRGNITLSYGLLNTKKNFNFTKVRDTISTYDPRRRGWYRMTPPGVARFLGAYIIAVGPPPRPWTGHMMGLYDTVGTPCGVLLMTWQASDLNNLLQRLTLGPDVLMLLSEASGIVMASTWADKDPFIVKDFLTPAQMTAAKEKPDPKCAYSDVANGANELLRVCRRTLREYNSIGLEISNTAGGSDVIPDGSRKITVRSTTYYVRSSTITNTAIDGLVLRLITVYPEDRVLGPVREGRDISVGLSVGWAIFCILLSGFVTRIVLRPLKKVADQMDELSDVKFESESKESTQRTAENVSALYEVRKVQTSFKGMKSTVQSFSKYVPIEVVRQLMVTGNNAVVGMHPCNVTIMFSDIVSFTSMCEKIDGMLLAVLVKKYFTAMTTVVMSHGGIVDKFIGDAIMAVWGTPMPVDIRNIRASAAVCLMRHINRQRSLQSLFHEHGFTLATRFGVHSGHCLSGNMGSEHRLSFTVIGDNVNLASRLEGLNKYFGTHAMISEDVAAEVRDDFVLRLLGAVRVVGRKAAIKVYEVVGLRADRTGSGGNASSGGPSPLAPPPATIRVDADDVVPISAADDHSLTTMMSHVSSNTAMTKEAMYAELLSGPGAVSPPLERYAKEYTTGMEMYLAGKFSEAVRAFQAAEGTGLGDESLTKMVTQCVELAANPPAEGTWEGVYEAHSK